MVHQFVVHQENIHKEIILLILVFQWEIKQSNSLDFKRSVVWLSNIQDLIIQLKVIKSYQECLLITALLGP